VDGDPFSNLNIHDNIQDFKSYKKPSPETVDDSASSNSATAQQTSEISVPCTLEELFWGSEKKIRIERRIKRDSDWTTEEKVVTVIIQAGSRDGSTIVLAKESDDGKDLICILKEQKHSIFERDITGFHLIHVIPISLVQALTGSTTFRIPTLSNRTIFITCPEVIHPSYERILKGEGMPMSVGDRCTRGDLIIRFHIRFPLTLSYTIRNRLKSALEDTNS